MDKKEYNLLIVGGNDFVVPYLDAELNTECSDTRVWHLGREEAELTVDGLINEIPVVPCEMDAVFYCDASHSSVKNYDETTAMQCINNLTKALEQKLPGAIVYVSTVHVYGKTAGEKIDESATCEPSTPYGRAKLAVEEYLLNWCSRHDVKLAIMRPSPIVGTGMGGELRRLVNRIYRATYRHVEGNEARVSVVHAVTVARAARLLMGKEGVWNVTDGTDPLRHDLAEALAWRLDHKRIYTVSAKRANLLARIGNILPVTGFTSQSLADELSTLTFDCSKLIADTGIIPDDVTNYLRNHIYDESSL